jgi:diaminopimelate epimerase
MCGRLASAARVGWGPGGLCPLGRAGACRPETKARHARLDRPSALVQACAVIVRFSKFEGLGNDFVVLRGEQVAELPPAALAALCDRHFGVGADGVLLTGLAQGSPFMQVINADGSQPEMCGNGLRCVALFLVEEQLVSGSEFEVQTAAGPHRVWLSLAGREAEVRVAMRPASLAAAELLHDARGEWIDRPFSLGERELCISAVSMGNPHAVLFDQVDAAEDMAWLGPRIERDPRFRHGANVGFARLRGPSAIDLTVWERGVGFTLACGTGACAAAVAAVESGRCARGEPITVTLPGGALRIRVGERGEPIEMTGPARRVFDGQLELEAPG